MDRSSSRRGVLTAPHSPIGSPFRWKSISNLLGKGSSNIGKKQQQEQEQQEQQNQHGYWTTLLHRTAPSSPRESQYPTAPRFNLRSKTVHYIEEVDVSDQTKFKNRLGSIHNHHHHQNDYINMNIEDSTRTTTTTTSMTSSSKGFNKSKKDKIPRHHRKSHSYEGCDLSSWSLHPTKEHDESCAHLPNVSSDNNADLGPLFLKLATAMYLAGEDSTKALECASRAAKLMAMSGRPNLDHADIAKSFHILASIHCRLGQYEEAIEALGRATRMIMPFSSDDQQHHHHHHSTIESAEESDAHYLHSSFLINMQLGDVLMMVGQQTDALASYNKAYGAQTRALGVNDHRVGQTCRYIAEAYLQALQLEEASQFCKHALSIHVVNGKGGSVEEAMDRQLMALILRESGQYKQALEQLVQANVVLTENCGAGTIDVALVDLSIGEMYMALGRYDEALFSYQRALSFFKLRYGEDHTSVAHVYVRLAEHYAKTGKGSDAKSYCESALGIYGRQTVPHSLEEHATGLTELALVYERMNEREQALTLLQRGLDILKSVPGHQNEVLGIEGQMGVLYYALGRYEEAFVAFNNAVLKLRAGGEHKSALVGSLLNQMGLACLSSNDIYRSIDLFLEAKAIFEEMWGIEHAYTLAVLSNLAGAYDALGRLEEAIGLLESIVMIKEECLGTMHPDTKEEKHRLANLLNEIGRERVQKTNTLKELLFHSACT